MKNSEICDCDYKPAQRDYKQGICFASSERCKHHSFCNDCFYHNHNGHQAECKSIERLGYELQTISDYLQKNLEVYQSFLKKLKERKVLNASWVLYLKKAKMILDDQYISASENNALQQKYQDPASTKKIFSYYKDEINSTKYILKEKKQQVDRLIGYLENQKYDRFFNSTPLIKKLFRKFEEYQQFNLKEKLEQEIINSKQKEIQFYNEKLGQINTLNELGDFNAASKPLRKLRKSFKSLQLDKLYGQQLMKCRKYDEAEQYYQNKSEENPKMLWPIEGRIDCLMEIGQSTKALSYVDLLLKNRKKSFKLLHKKRFIQQKLGLNTENRESATKN